MAARILGDRSVATMTRPAPTDWIAGQARGGFDSTWVPLLATTDPERVS